MKYRLTTGGIATESGFFSEGNREWRKYLKWVGEGNTPYPDDSGIYHNPIFDWDAGTWSEGETAQELADRTARNAARAKMRTDNTNGSPNTMPGLSASVDAILEILKHQGFMKDE